MRFVGEVSAEMRKGRPSFAPRVVDTHRSDYRDFLGRRKISTSDNADELYPTMNRCNRQARRQAR